MLWNNTLLVVIRASDNIQNNRNNRNKNKQNSCPLFLELSASCSVCVAMNLFRKCHGGCCPDDGCGGRVFIASVAAAAMAMAVGCYIWQRRGLGCCPTLAAASCAIVL